MPCIVRKLRLLEIDRDLLVEIRAIIAAAIRGEYLVLRDNDIGQVNGHDEVVLLQVGKFQGGNKGAFAGCGYEGDGIAIYWLSKCQIAYSDLAGSCTAGGLCKAAEDGVFQEENGRFCDARAGDRQVRAS